MDRPILATLDFVEESCPLTRRMPLQCVPDLGSRATPVCQRVVSPALHGLPPRVGAALWAPDWVLALRDAADRDEGADEPQTVGVDNLWDGRTYTEVITTAGGPSPTGLAAGWRSPAGRTATGTGADRA